jgi:AraC-like DNA-binding protein
MMSPDWFSRARNLDVALSSDSPLIAETNAVEGPSPLALDIHDGIEVGVVLSGLAERHFRDCVLSTSPGDIWLCAMWEPHGRRVLSSRTEHVVMMFLPEFLGEEMIGDRSWLSVFAAPPSQRPWVVSPQVRRQAVEIGRCLYTEIADKPRFWDTSVRLELVRLLFAISRHWDPPDPLGRRHAGASDLTRIMPALTLIRAHPDRRIRLGEAAYACGLSATRFAVVFNHTVGLSFGRFALRARLAFVARRLLTTQASIERIASEAGFVDASHLHRAFVRHYGCTPGRYRERAEPRASCSHA